MKASRFLPGFMVRLILALVVACAPLGAGRGLVPEISSAQAQSLTGVTSVPVLTAKKSKASLEIDFTTNSASYLGSKTRPAALPGWTFARASSGYAETRGGQLLLFGAGEPRITDRGLLVEEARTNVQTYSQAIGGAQWGVQNTTVSSATLAPDGTLTASDLTNTPSANSFVSAPTIALANSTTYTRSIYAKNISGNGVIAFEYNRGTTLASVSFDTSTGTISATTGGGATGASITLLGNGWYRCIATFTTDATGTPSARIVYVGTYGNTPTTNTVRVWGAQLEVGSFASTYIPTIAAAATRAADSAYITGLGPILGQFRTNLAQYSADASNGQWAPIAAAKTTGQADPFGGTGAALITANGVNVPHYQTASDSTVSFVVGATYTMSRYVKAGTGQYVQLSPSGGVFSGAFANFDLVGGTITAQVGLAAPATMTSVGSGWYRISIAAVATGTATSHAGVVFLVTSPTSARGEANTLTSSFYDYGAQVGVGTTLDPFIVTQGAPTSAGNPFTMVAWADLPAIDNVRRVMALASDGTNTNRFMLHRESTGDGTVQSINSGSSLLSVIAGKTGARTLKIAGRSRASDLRGAIDGTFAPSAAAAAPPGLNRIDLGNQIGGGNALNGYVQRIGVYGDLPDGALTQSTIGPISAANDNDPDHFWSLSA